MSMPGLFNRSKTKASLKYTTRLLLYFSLVFCANAGLAAAPQYTMGSGQWHQLVVPGNSSASSIRDVFTDELPADQYNSSWVVYLWDNVAAEYVNPGLDGSFPTGQGFWMIQVTGESVTFDVDAVADAPLTLSSACPSPDGCTEVTLFETASNSTFGMIGSAQRTDQAVDLIRFVAPSIDGVCGDGCSHSAAAEAGLIETAIRRYNPTTETYENLSDTSVLGPWESAWFERTGTLTGLAVKYLFPGSTACTFTNPDDPSDDPNPPYDGTEGRYPVSTNPIPAGFPTPLTTGICGAGLSPADLLASDGITIEVDGTVIDKLDIAGNVKVMANNVTIKRSRITGYGYYTLQLINGYSNLTVEDTRIRTNNVLVPAAPAVLVNGSAMFRRVHISGGSDNLKSNSGNLVVENSYLGGTYRSPGSHNDVLQVRNGDNYQIRGSTLFAPYQTSTSAFLFQAKSGGGGGPITNVVIEGNYLSGGSYTGYTRAPDFPMLNVEVRNNVFEADSWQFGYKSDDAGASWYDNYDSNGVRLD